MVVQRHLSLRADGKVEGAVRVRVQVMVVVVVMVVQQRIDPLKVQTVVVPVDDGDEQVGEAEAKGHAHEEGKDKVARQARLDDPRRGH